MGFQHFSRYTVYTLARLPDTCFSSTAGTVGKPRTTMKNTFTDVVRLISKIPARQMSGRVASEMLRTYFFLV